MRDNKLRWAGLSVVFLLAALMILKVERSSARLGTVAAKKTSSQPSASNSIALLSTPSAQAAATGSRNHPNSAGDPNPAMPQNAFTEFAAWADKFLVAPNASRSAIPVAEGVKLARARRDEMARMIRVNPGAAVAHAAPWRWRQELPREVAALLEEQPSARGSLEVFCAVPLPGEDHHETEGCTIRYATFGDRAYRAYVYGRRTRQMTRKDVPLHGVAIDNIMAVAEEPLRVLDADEAAAKEGAGATSGEACPVCGEAHGHGVLADQGGQLLNFCSAAHAGEMNRTLAAAEDALPGEAAFAQAPVPGSGNTPPPVSPSWTLGPHPVLYIRAVFADDATEPISEAEAAATMDAVNKFYVEASYNKTALITTITPVLTLPQIKVAYGARGPGLLADDARQAARLAGYEPDNYDLVIIRHTNVPGFPWGGLGGGGTAWLQSSGAGVVAHEIGHNYGLPHAEYWETRWPGPPANPENLPIDADSIVGRDSIYGAGDDVSYGDDHDVMGGGGGESVNPADTNVISSLNGHFNAIGKFLLGWLPTSYIADGDKGVSTRLYVHDTPTLVAGRTYAIATRKDEQRSYWVSARSRFPTDPWLANGVELHYAPWQQSVGYSQVLDTTPGSKDGKQDAPLLIGRTFSDRAAEVHITPTGKGGTASDTWFDVVVNVGPFPDNVPPVVELGASASQVAAGAAVTFTAKASDANGDRMAFYWDFGDGSFGTNAATVAKAWTNAGDFVVRCEVSDMKGGMTSKHLVVRVGSPTTLRISGHVMDIFGQPLVGARVSNGRVDGTDLADDFQSTYTDSDGAYTIANLAPDTLYPVGVYLEGYITKPLNFDTPLKLTDRDTLNANFEARPLPRVTVKAIKDANATNGSPGTFELTRTGDTNTSLRAMFILAGSAAPKDDYVDYTNTVVYTNINPNPFAPITNTFIFQYVDFATNARTTNIVIQPSTNAPAGAGDKYVSLTVMHALQAQRITGVTNTNVVDFTGWEIVTVNGQRTIFQTDPDYIPGNPSDTSLLIRGKVAALPSISVVALDATASENRNDSGLFVVTRFGRTDVPVTVSLQTSGTAVSGSDYEPLPTSVNIPAGQSLVTIPVLVRPNQFLDGNKTVQLKVLTNSTYTVASSTATVTILDDDLPNVTITSLTPVTDGTGIFAVTRTGDISQSLVVNYLVTGTAVSGSDYRTLAGSVTIPAGQPATFITVTARTNPARTSDRTLTVLLSDSPVYNVGSLNTATMVIQASSLPVVTIAANVTGISEGDAAGTGGFTVTRTGDLSRELLVNFKTGGTARPLADYAGLGSQIRIPAGVDQVTVSINPVDDSIVEDTPETVSIQLLPGAGYNVGDPDSDSLAITDNDNGLVGIGFALLSSSMVEAGGTNSIVVTMTGNPPPDTAVTVDYKIIGGTAVAGIDYPPEIAMGRLVFTNGPSSGDDAYTNRIQLISVPVFDNTNAQPNRTIVFTLLEPAPDVTNEVVTNIVDDPANPGVQMTNVVTNIVVTPVPMNAIFDTYKSHTFTIVDDDASIVTVEATDPVAEEGGKAGLFTIRRSNTNGTQKVYFQFSGTAAAGSDFPDIPSPIEIPAGQDSVDLLIVPVDDPIQEYREDVRITLLRAPGAQLGDPSVASLDIADNDGTVEFTATAFSTPESVGVAQVPVRRTGDTNVTASVQFLVSAGTAIAGTDFAPTNGILTFAPGEVLKYVPVTIIDDAIVETAKTVNLLLRNADDGSALGGQGTTTLTILDDDTAVEFSQAAYRAYENATNAVITLRRVGVATNSFSVDYITSTTSATNGVAEAGVDYVATNGTVNFGPGQTVATFQVRLLDDALMEGDEKLSLTLTNATLPAVLGSQSTSELVIVDDECRLEFALAGNSAPEYAGNALVDVRRIGGTANPVSVAFATKPGTAKAGRDFAPLTGTIGFAGDAFVLPADGSGVLQFRPGETNKTISVRIIDNTVGEGDRQFTVELSNPRVNASAAAGSVVLGALTNTVVTIQDNETPGQLDYEFNPGQGTDGNVRSVSLQTDGKTLLGGEFTKVDGLVLNRIARLHTDGFLDSFLNTGGGADGTVYAVVAQPDGRALVGGNFASINGTTRARIARLKGDGTIDDTFLPGAGANAAVRAIAVQPGGAMIIGGEFTTVGGISRIGVARLNADGSLDTTFNPVGGAGGGAVLALAVQSDGKILVGGSFVTIAGTSRPYLARLNSNGSLDASFQLAGAPNLQVRSLAIAADGRIIAGGDFTSIGGAALSGVARFLANGSLDPEFAPGTGTIGAVYAVGVQPDGKVYLGGNFTNFNGVALNRLCRLNADGSVDDGFDIGTGVNGIVRTLAVQPDTAVVIGGDFSIVRGLPRSRIARVHGDDKFTPNKIQFSSSTYQVPEDGSSVAISVKRVGDTAGAVTIGYTTDDGTAVAGVNYVAAQGTLSFGPGETIKTFSVQVLNDRVARGNTTVKLSLTNVPPGFSLSAQLTAILTIEGAEGSIAFTSADYTVFESDGAAAIGVRLSRPSVSLVTVQFATADGTATNGVDYVAVNGTVTFAPGQTNQTVLVPIINENQPRNDRSLSLLLSNVSGAALGAQSTATLNISDDDRGPSFHVEVTQVAGGSVSPGSKTYPPGSVKTYTAEPIDGFAFVRWDGTTNTTQNPLTLVIDRDYVLTAVFRPESYTYDFEPPFASADLGSLPWSRSGNALWELEPTGATSGNRFQLRSGKIGNSQESTIELSVYTRAGAGSFDVRVSSEGAWDFLEFFVNGVRLQRWSGEVPWQTYLFPLAGGENKLTWRYVKDPNFSSGLDAAFIDNLYVPVSIPGADLPPAKLRAVLLSTGTPRIQLQGQPGNTYVVEVSTDLSHWTPIWTNQLENTSTIVTDPGLGSTTTRFYRAITR